MRQMDRSGCNDNGGTGDSPCCMAMEHGYFRVSDPANLRFFIQCFRFTPEKLQWAKERILEEQSANPGLTQHQIDLKRCALAFKYLPCFLNNQAADLWQGAFHFRILDLCDYTLTVENGKAVTRKGLAGRALCVIKADLRGLCHQLGLLGSMGIESGPEDELDDSQLDLVAGGKTIPLPESYGPCRHEREPGFSTCPVNELFP